MTLPQHVLHTRLTQDLSSTDCFFANIMEPVGWSWFGQLHLGQFEKKWTTYKTCWVSEKSWLFLWWNATIFWDVNKKQLHEPFSKISFRRRTIIPEEKELIQQLWVVCHVMIRSHFIPWVFGYHILPKITVMYTKIELFGYSTHLGSHPKDARLSGVFTIQWPPTNRHREMHWINCSSLKIFKQKRRRSENCSCCWSVFFFPRGYEQWPKSWLFVVCKGLPSRKLTYPPKMPFWRWFSFSQGGIC